MPAVQSLIAAAKSSASASKAPAPANQATAPVADPSARIPDSASASVAYPPPTSTKRLEHPIESPPKLRKKARQPSPEAQESDEDDGEAAADPGSPQAEDDEDDGEASGSQTVPEAIATRTRGVKLTAEDKRIRFHEKYANLNAEQTLGEFVLLGPVVCF